MSRSCPGCRTANPDDARFCLQCGTALDGQPSTSGEVRKTVTVLFADIVGSTELGERHDPEAVRRTLRDYFATVRSIIERHGGRVEKYIGDAVMAVFGLPAAHEDDALRAMRAAWEIQAALSTSGPGPAAGQPAIRVRLGVNTGTVVAGTGRADETLVTGDAVNVAARLEQVARPGDVIVGAATVQLVRDEVQVEPLAPLAVRGKAEPVAAFRLVGVTPVPAGRTPTLDAPMVGRDGELRQVRETFDQAVAERSTRLVTILGPAGVGKSRLVRELITAVGTGALALRGRCLPYGEGITFWPVAEIVRRAAGIDEAATAEAARARIEATLGTRPDAATLGHRLAQVIGLEKAEAPLLPEELSWAVRRFLESLAASRPLLVVIEDVHWAEPTLLDLVEHVASLARDAPILLVCTARLELLDDRPAWGAPENATTLRLDGLPADASAQLIGNLLSGDVPPAVRERIGAVAEGNPLFLEEYVGMLVDEGAIRSEGGRWILDPLATVAIPPTIEALLAARLDRLPSTERAAAGRASVVGRVFEQVAVVELSPVPERGRVPIDLSQLVRRELIRPEPSVGSDDASYRFRHILIRDAAYGSLPKADRADLHVRYADWLERRAAERLGEVAPVLGYHLEQAHAYRLELGIDGSDGDGLALRAGDHLLAAGRAAIGRGDAEAGVNLLARAVALLPPSDPRRDLASIDLATQLRERGELPRSLDIVDEIAARARAAGDEVLEAHATVAGWFWRIDSGSAPAEAVDHARAALRTFEAAGDDLGQARAWRLLGDAYWTMGMGGASEHAVLRTLELARRVGDLSEEAAVYETLSALFNTGPTPIADGIARCEEILVRHPDSPAVEAWMSHALAHLHGRLGEFDKSRRLAARTREILAELGQLLQHRVLSEVVADVEMLAGEPAAAASVLREALDASVESWRPMLSAFLSGALVADRDIEGAEKAAEVAIRDGRFWDRANAQATLARVRAVQGRLDEAIALADAAVTFFERTDFLTFHAEARLALAEVLRHAGRTDEARAAIRQARELHDRKGSIVGVSRADAAMAALDAPSGT